MKKLICPHCLKGDCTFKDGKKAILFYLVQLIHSDTKLIQSKSLMHQRFGCNLYQMHQKHTLKYFWQMQLKEYILLNVDYILINNGAKMAESLVAVRLKAVFNSNKILKELAEIVTKS